MSVRLTHSIRALVLATLLGGGLLPSSVDAATVTVHIGQSLSPPTLTVAPGTSVRWVNESDNRYRMRSRNGPEEFDSGNLEPGESFTFTFTRTGTYPYLDDRDRDDQNFHGTIVVTSSGGGAAPNPPSGGGSGGAAPGSATVHMANRAFGPSSVTIAAGGSVAFVNDDDREHTATGDAFDTGVLDSGAQSRQTFPSAGTFTFLCQIHPEMRGTINVRGADGAALPTAPPATPEPTPTSTPTIPFAVAAVAIQDFDFGPVQVDIAAGTTVTWQNQGAAPHTVSAGDGSFDSGLLDPGSGFSRTFDAPGRFAYACQLHPDMQGTVVVGAVAASTSPSAAASPAGPAASAAAPTTGGDTREASAADSAIDLAASAQAVTSDIRDGIVRLIVVAAILAGAIIAFGVLVVGSVRPPPRRRTR